MIKQMQFDDTQQCWQGALAGELDAVEAPKLIAEMQGYLLSKQGDVVLDCKQLEFVDSMGLGALVKLRKIVEEAGGAIKLVHMKKRIYKLFVITGLSDSFGIEVEA